MPAQPQPLRLNHRHFHAARTKSGHAPPHPKISRKTSPRPIPYPSTCVRLQIFQLAPFRIPFFSRYTQTMGILRRLSRWMGTQDHMTHIVAGNLAPGFSLKALDNKEYSLSALMERGPVVAAFFKISCPVRQFTYPFLERLHKRYGREGATFLGSSQDNARSTAKFAKEDGGPFPVLIDDENGYSISNAYGLTSVPTIFLIDTDGAVKLSCMGFDKKDLERIAADLAERRKISLAPLFRPDEVVPANKPG